jgi:hypothetical protein
MVCFLPKFSDFSFLNNHYSNQLLLFQNIKYLPSQLPYWLPSWLPFQPPYWLPSIFTMDSTNQYGDGATSPMFCSLHSASSPTPSLVPNMNPLVHSNALNDIFRSWKYDGLELAFFLKDCSYYHHVPMSLLRTFFQICKAPI